jgi:hypothetical protein
MAKKNRKNVVEPVVDPFAEQRAVIAGNDAMRTHGGRVVAVPPVCRAAVENPFLVRSQAIRAEAAADEAKRTAKETLLQPTRQTETRLRPDVLNRMLKSGSLTTQQGWAADQIHAVYTAVLAGLLAKAGMAERRSPGKTELAEKLAEWRKDHYIPWTDYLGGHAQDDRRPARLGKCREALQLAIEVVIDGRSLEECEQMFGWRRKGTAGEVLRYALAVYSDIAGWERNGEMMMAFEEKWNRPRRKAA